MGDAIVDMLMRNFKFLRNGFLIRGRIVIRKFIGFLWLLRHRIKFRWMMGGFLFASTSVWVLFTAGVSFIIFIEMTGYLIWIINNLFKLKFNISIVTFITFIITACLIMRNRVSFIQLCWIFKMFCLKFACR